MLGPLFAIKLIVLLAVATLFAFLDVFNRRNIPNSVAYAGLAAAVVLALTYPPGILLIGVAAALVFGVAGYLLYIKGQLGAGDVIEFIIIALLIPIQQNPVFVSTRQFALPFILSVFINAGFIAILVVPIIYVALSRQKTSVRISRTDAGMAILLFAMYAAFLLFITLVFGFRLFAAVFILLLAVASAAIMLFEKRISMGMVEMVYPSELEEGDIIETSLMSMAEMSFFSKKSKRFGRLARKAMIEDLRGVRKKLPVYERGVPFALFLLFGILTAFGFGNLILLIV